MISSSTLCDTHHTIKILLAASQGRLFRPQNAQNLTRCSATEQLSQSDKCKYSVNISINT